MGLEIHLIVGLICGIIAAVIASSKGRNAIGWFFGGFFLGIIGIIIVAVISNLAEERARRDADDIEHQRLRERLAQEKMKAEIFRQHAQGRLDVHDGALQMDTRAISGPQVSQALLSDGQVGSLPPPNPSKAKWFYDNKGETMGPVSAMKIKELLLENRIDSNTLVWAEELTDWTPVGKVGEFRSVNGT